MTEVDKFAGKFLERQRQQKAMQKQERKIDKATKNSSASDNSDKEEKQSKKKEADESTADKEGNELSEKEQIKLRKFLEDGCEFKGLVNTAVAILKKEDSKQLKVKVLAQKIGQVFRLSEDYDSDESDIEDDVKFFLDKKKILKKLKKAENSHLERDGKVLKYVK